MAAFFCTVIEQRGMSDRRTTVGVEAIDREQAIERAKEQVFPASVDWAARRHVSVQASRISYAH